MPIVTKENVIAAFDQKLKIELIKLYRNKFDVPLKEAKDVIEKYLPYNPFSNGTVFDSPVKKAQILNLFFPPTINENEENSLYFAITKMKENWKTLGYKSFKDGILSILNNF